MKTIKSRKKHPKPEFLRYKLPFGWFKECVLRKSGDRYDTYLKYEDNKFHSNERVQNFLEKNPDVKIDKELTTINLPQHLCAKKKTRNSRQNRRKNKKKYKKMSKISAKDEESNKQRGPRRIHNQITQEEKILKKIRELEGDESNLGLQEVCIPGKNRAVVSTKKICR